MAMNDFGTYLRDLRQTKNLSLRAVQREAGISPAYLSLVEQGKRPAPHIPYLLKLARLYTVSPAEIMAKAGTLVGTDLEGLGQEPATPGPAWLPPKPRNRDLRQAADNGGPLVAPALREALEEADAYYFAWERLRAEYFLICKERAELRVANDRLRQQVSLLKAPAVGRSVATDPDALTVYADGSYDRDRRRAGIGVLVVGKSGVLATLCESLIPIPGACSDWVEWEASLRGVELALRLGAHKVHLVIDYRPLAEGRGVSGRAGALQYLEGLKTQFLGFEVQVVPRNQNQRAHDLAFDAMRNGTELKPWISVDLPELLKTA